MTKIKDQIIFDKSAEKKILEYFNKAVDNEGYVIEKSTGSYVLTSSGQKVHVDYFGGIFKGSEIFVKSDIVSVIQFLQKTHDLNTG